MKKGKSLSIFALLLLSIAVVLTSCGGDSDSSGTSLEMLSATGTAPMNGVWGDCYGPGTRDGVTTTTDSMETFTFTGSSGLYQIFSYTSVNVSCSGVGTEIPDENIPFTITVDGEKMVAWSDGSAMVSPPNGLPATPTVSTFTLDAGAEGTFGFIFYMDDRTTPWKIYRGREEPSPDCDLDGNGYPSCLMTVDLLIKQ